MPLSPTPSTLNRPESEEAGHPLNQLSNASSPYSISGYTYNKSIGYRAYYTPQPTLASYEDYSAPQNAAKGNISIAAPKVFINTSPEAVAARALSGSTTTKSVLVGSKMLASVNSGLHFNLTFDTTATASFINTIESAAALISSFITDNITINVAIHSSGTGGGAYAGPDNGYYIPYSTVVQNLLSNSTASDAYIYGSLPRGSTIQGQSDVAVWNSQLKLWGTLNANDLTTTDGSATFATDIQPSLLEGVALHELTHVLGRIPWGSPYSTSPDIFDFYRFSSPGTRLFEFSAPASRSAYFSLDNGLTKIADYGVYSDPSDFLNSGVQGSSDPFNEYYGWNTFQYLTNVDITQLKVLGYHVSNSTVAPPTINDANIVRGYVNAARDTSTQALSGIADANGTVNIYLNDSLSPIYSVVADNAGNWSQTIGVLADGSYTYTATVTNGVGVTSVSSAPLTFTVDTTVAAAPTLSLALDSGASSADKITNSGLVNLAGLEAGASWQYSTNNGVSWISGYGSSLTLSGDGAKSLIARQTDIAGNVSAISAALAFTLDTRVATPTLSLALDSGASSADKITNSGLVNLAGLEAGASWQYSTNNGVSWISGYGSSLTLSGDGAKTLIARQTDIAGNVSANSAALAFTVDTVAAAAPILSLALDSGASSADKITNSGLVNLAGLGAGASWQYSTNNGVSWISGYGSSLTLSGDGAKTLIARQTDLAGNVSANSAALAFTLDTRVATPTLSLALDSGASSADKITNSGLVNLAGLEAGASWQYSTNNGASWISGYGSSLTLTGDGAKTLIARQTDLAGNVSANSAALAFTLDTIAPIAPTLNAPAYSSSRWTVSGAAEANSSITIFDGATRLGSTIANSSGTWSFTTAQNNSSSHVYNATSTDLAGNSGTRSSNFYEGTAGNDIFNIVANALGDQVAGGAGNDVYNMVSLSNSIASHFYSVTDFNQSGVDAFKIGHAVTAANFKTVASTGVSGLTGNLANDLGRILTTSNFAANGADLVNISLGADAGLYAVINDGVSGFNALTDGVVKVQTGANLTASSFTA